MKKHILGFPRIGARRELKFALESFWNGEIPAHSLTDCARALRLNHWKIQRRSGLSHVATGDFSLYDQMLDTSAMLGAIPERFRSLPSGGLSSYFAMARGDRASGTPAMEMTKWFNTNYHYIVPEIDGFIRPELSCRQIIDETREAAAAGFSPKPVLIGPVTYLALAKGVDGYDCWRQLDAVTAVYEQVLRELAPVCEWIQLDEPILSSDLPAAGRGAFADVYRRLNTAAGNAKILLATYFDTLDDNLDLAFDSGCAGLHLDLVRGGANLDAVLAGFPAGMILSAGIVEGRNIWRNDFDRSLEILRRIEGALGDRLMVASSCSLLHCPVDLECETALDSEIRSWMAFAVQKCAEVSLLGDLVSGIPHDAELLDNRAAASGRRASSRVCDAKVRARLEAVTAEMRRRRNPYPVRKKAQEWLGLPLFPTTTIGSFPQTADIRAARRAAKRGEITPSAYREIMRGEIAEAVRRQEEIGLDVLVHGEPERNDMVEYFGQQLDGFCFTANGWVQSYGSRCVKPPVIYGDISRPAPMTVEWITYAQSLTGKPMKGMLTGPVTILCWSFVRDDMPRSEVCGQIALAICDEVRDLEKAGIRIIQIDEAAFSEGMPVKERKKPAYLEWAAGAFRLATSSVADSTQIHTHMCYSEFNRIIQAIADMDADVISIESSRSKMEILESFRDYEYPNEIGPGVYDIHSPRIPSKEEMLSLLERAMRYIPKERLWVNPDCGLKTRNWAEVIPSLRNMVAAARELRENAER
ncbi:MAG: 5-methyltetrahydropteroyltriglutamate--homocysteine S-methyltransferase [Victivallaceae bacterium]